MFNQYKAVEKLRELERSPIDLTVDGVLSAKRVEEMSASALGIKMLYASERVTSKVLESLYDLAKEANVFEKISAMQAGDVINKIEGFESENRSVLHTAMRDFFDNQQTSKVAKEASEAATWRWKS